MEKGLTEAKIDELDKTDGDFTERERLALEFAERMAVDHHNIGDDFFAELATEFNEPEILELGMLIGQYIGFGRLLQVLDLTPRSCPAEPA
jgi:alkylhydroperoxidase family enzyme